jgi:hypothetical protein
MFLHLAKSKTKLFMKKLSLLSIAALFVATSFTSCKKDYTCACSGNSLIPTANYEYKKVKKADAEEACTAQSTAYGVFGGGSCKLK